MNRYRMIKDTSEEYVEPYQRYHIVDTENLNYLGQPYVIKNFLLYHEAMQELRKLNS